MAITNNGTKNSLHQSQIPTGYSRPNVSTFSDEEYVRDLTLSVLKATVENATQATTMTNIIANGTIGITKQVDDIIAAEFLTAPTVTVYADLIGLTNNLVSMLGDSVALGATAASYICTVKLYVKSV